MLAAFAVVAPALSAAGADGELVPAFRIKVQNGLMVTVAARSDYNKIEIDSAEKTYTLVPVDADVNQPLTFSFSEGPTIELARVALDDITTSLETIAADKISHVLSYDAEAQCLLCQGAEAAEITVYDAVGRVALRGKAQRLLSVGSLCEGLYIATAPGAQPLKFIRR